MSDDWFDEWQFAFTRFRQMNCKFWHFDQTESVHCKFGSIYLCAMFMFNSDSWTALLSFVYVFALFIGYRMCCCWHSVYANCLKHFINLWLLSNCWRRFVFISLRAEHKFQDYFGWRQQNSLNKREQVIVKVVFVLWEHIFFWILFFLVFKFYFNHKNEISIIYYICVYVDKW